MAARTVDSGRIPQANTLERVVTLVRALCAGNLGKVYDEFAHSRDRGFYVAAARVLGLVDERGALTRSGRQIAAARDSEVWRALAIAFANSGPGEAWMRWAGVDDVRRLDPASAKKFLKEKGGDFSDKTKDRRASTLTAWAETLIKILPPLPSKEGTKRSLEGTSNLQLSLGEFEEDRGAGGTRITWPSPKRFPHNEGGSSVRRVLVPDLRRSKDLLIETGYASLNELIRFFAEVSADAEGVIRLLVGFEPRSSLNGRHPTPVQDLSREIRDYWLERNVSVTLSSAVLHVRQLVTDGRIVVRGSSASRPMHAKLYVADDSVVLGSSNFSANGLGDQSEANVRFTSADGRRMREVRALAEGLWANAFDYTQGFLDLLDTLLKSVTWQEALARACASVLEGDWAKKYVAPELFEQLDRPLWRHQIQGVSQAMWVLENVGSVLVADSAGSGKTRMGAWLVRAAFDRQYRVGFIKRPTPLIVSPPQVMENWESALGETGLTFQVQSHGPLSNTKALKHEQMLRSIAETELLAVDEAHNFVNRSARTNRLIAHYAENSILFTATPINRNAADLLALVELLGADNLPDETLDRLMMLRRTRGAAPTQLQAEYDLLRSEIRRFTVRRTRTQLNRIALAHPEESKVAGRQARYPEHLAKFYRCRSGAGDDEIATRIAALARQLKGVTRIGTSLRIPFGWKRSEAGYLRQVVASAAALARHHVMSCLRSSRAALVEHALGSQKAVDIFLAQRRIRASKSATGDMVSKALKIAGVVPEWHLRIDQMKAPDWLWDPSAHAAACAEDSGTYREIAELAQQLSDQRERDKVARLETLVSTRGIVIGFDSHVISLHAFEHALRERDVPVECLTGEGGPSAKRRAVAKLGLAAKTERLVALCSDAFSEGLNLQKASCVVHLDTPTVIRVAEQRAGRVDRMDSPHDNVQIWWPDDQGAFVPLRRELLEVRHETVKELIGANLLLPRKHGSSNVRSRRVTSKELANQATVEHLDNEFEARRLYDAFRPVRGMVEGESALVDAETYERLRTSQAEVVACVSVVRSREAWAFFSVGGLERAAPRWVFFSSPAAEPVFDLAHVSEEVRRRVTEDRESAPLDSRADLLISEFVQRLRECEIDLLPVRRRRALRLLESSIETWLDGALKDGRYADASGLRQLREWLCFRPEERRDPFPDPGSIADAWIRLLRPKVRKALDERRTRRKPFRLDDLAGELKRNPVPIDQIWRAFDGVRSLSPVDQRVMALVIGVPAT